LTDPVKYEIEKGLAVLCLDSPDTRNALSFELLENLSYALKLIANDSEAKVAVLTASGKVFSAGMDLKNIHLDDAYEAAKFADLLSEVYRDLLRLPIPLLCGVDGRVLGGAVGIALAADLLFAGPKAEFAFPETRIGVVPALVSVIARRRVHPAQLSGLALTGIVADSNIAVRIGLADSLSSQSATKDCLLYARKICLENSGEAMRRTKQFLQQHSLIHLEEDLALASQEFQIAVNTRAARQGLKAFREKRPAVWNEGLEETQ
jgi:enoyl-CoA hydratase/carnithine racemase